MTDVMERSPTRSRRARPAASGGNGTSPAPDNLKAQWEIIAQAIAHEREEEANFDGLDGHEPAASEPAKAAPPKDETDELTDGDEGQPGSAGRGDGVYREGRGESARGSDLEVEGYDPALEQADGLTSLPPGLLSAADLREVVGAEAARLLEVVHGHDDRVRVHNTTDFAWRTICRLQITTADGRTSGCSGAFIGPRTVLTNGHCVFFHDRGGWARQIRVIPGANGSAEPFGSVVSSDFRSVKGWTESRSSNHDYAVIVLPPREPLGRRVGWMGLANLSTLTLMGLRVNSAGYPGDKPGGFMWWNANNILAVTDRRVYYRLDTFNGQSGSPVWRLRNGNRHIVAVHNTGGTPFNGAVRLSKPVFDNLVSWKNEFS